MNKTERTKVATLIAEWEWVETGSGAEASGYATAAEALTRDLGLADHPDLAWARTWRIAELCACTDNEDDIFLISAAVEDDYSNLIDTIDEVGFEGLLADLRRKPARTA